MEPQTGDAVGNTEPSLSRNWKEGVESKIADPDRIWQEGPKGRRVATLVVDDVLRPAAKVAESFKTG